MPQLHYCHCAAAFVAAAGAGDASASVAVVSFSVAVAVDVDVAAATAETAAAAFVCARSPTLAHVMVAALVSLSATRCHHHRHHRRCFRWCSHPVVGYTDVAAPPLLLAACLHSPC